MYTKRVLMQANLFELNWGPASFGLLLKEINDSVIIDNRFLNNSTGLYTESSNRLQIKHNVFENNGWAVKIMANSMDNYFTDNDFINNSFAVSTNSRQNFNTFDGNYWEGYKGYDLDRDGTGDVPYRPVGLFSLIVEKQHPALVLLKSFFINLLEVSESIFPVLTPETLSDNHPRMRRIH
jgi:nitrous oxidase accessory protein